MELTKLHAENARPRMVRDVLGKATAHFAGFKVMYACTARHKKHRPVFRACDVVGVSRSGFFENTRRKSAEQPSKLSANKRSRKEALLAHIRAIYVGSRAQAALA